MSTTIEEDVRKILIGNGIIENKVDGINEHLKVLNGSVIKLYGKAEANKDSIHVLESKLLIHEKDCPGLAEIHEITRKLDTGDFHGSMEVREKLIVHDTKEKDAQDIRDKFGIPLLKWLVAAIGFLLLMNKESAIRIFKGLL